MFKTATNFNHAIAGKGFFQRGITSSVTLEIGKQAYKAIGKLDAVIVAFNEVVKVKVNEYNQMLEKEQAGDREKTLSAALVAKKIALEQEIDALKEKPFLLELPDDQYKALVKVIDQSVPALYALVQKSNENKLEKDEKAPNLAEFQWLQAFQDDLADAEKMKGKEE